MSVLDLRNKDEETLFQRFDAQTRWAIRRAQRNQIKLTQAGPEKLPDFMRIIDHTAARRGFDTQDETYYRELFQAYGSQVKLILAEMDLSAYQRALRKEQMQKQTELSEIQGLAANAPDIRRCCGKNWISFSRNCVKSGSWSLMRRKARCS